MNMNQVTLPVKNMTQTAQFYVKLGFIKIVDTPHYVRFECPMGESSFSLSLDDGLFENGAIIYFEHEHLDQWVEQIKSTGIQFDRDPQDQKYLWREALLRDPSGNKIKLYWAGDNRLNPPWKISASD